MPSLVLNRASCTSATLVALVQFPVICHATIKEMDGCAHYSECVNELWFAIWMLITVATIIYFVLLAWTCWISDRVRKKFCYLCEDLVSKHEWVNGSHRRECQKHRMHKEFLARLPTPYASIECPDCSETLRVWPSNRGPVFFTCDGDNCIYEGYELKNTGDNRFNCFRHNFNLCKACVETKLPSKNSDEISSRTSSSTVLPRTAPQVNIKLNTTYSVTSSSEVPRRPFRNKTPLKISKCSNSKSPHPSGDSSSRQSSEMSNLLSIEEASPNPESGKVATQAPFDRKKSADRKVSADKKNSVASKSAIHIAPNIVNRTKTADKPEPPERQDSGDTLTDVNVTSGDNLENSDETLVDQNEITEANADVVQDKEPKEEATDDAFTAKIEPTLPETSEPEVDTASNPVSDNPDDQAKENQEKWSRSKSYAQACNIDVDTLKQGC